jgi:hypothetical protein
MGRTGVPGGRSRRVKEEESPLSWNSTLSSSLSPDPARARKAIWRNTYHSWHTGLQRDIEGGMEKTDIVRRRGEVVMSWTEEKRDDSIDRSWDNVDLAVILSDSFACLPKLQPARVEANSSQPKQLLGEKEEGSWKGGKGNGETMTPDGSGGRARL